MGGVSATAKSASPWMWRLPAGAWFELHASLIDDWRPDPALGLPDSFHRLVTQSASSRAEWLYHPFLGAVTLNERNLSRDLRLSLWAAAHQPDDAGDLGSITVPKPDWMWSPDGGTDIPAGTHPLRQLAKSVCGWAQTGGSSLALDLWLDTVGLPLPAGIVDYERWSWSHYQPLSEQDETQLRENVVQFLTATKLLSNMLPACAEWVATATKIVVPLRGTPETRFRSGSSASLPGLVFTDIDGPVEQILESLVHESAHHWFCIAEADGPMVDPGHRSTYTSPLRADPRPLRGIFLAFHALAFMSAYYSDWAGVRPELKSIPKMLDSVRRLRDDAGRTLEGARSALTDAGRRMLDETNERVISHAA